MQSHTRYKSMKDSDPIFRIQNPILANSLVQRALWVPAIAASAGMVPMSFIGNTLDWWNKKCSYVEAGKKLRDCASVSIKYVAVTLASVVIDPAIGKKNVRAGVNPADELYQFHAREPADFAKLDPIRYPRGSFIVKPLKIMTDKGPLDAVEILPGVKHPTKNDKVIIQFCGAGHNYQQVANYIVDDVINLGCSIVAVNYPGVTFRHYVPEYSGDLENVGRAVLHSIAKHKQSTNKQIEKDYLLVGYSMGGGVATSAKKYCQDEFGINVSLYVNRSYTSIVDSAAAGFYQGYFGIPFYYGKMMQSIFYTAAGGWNIDSKKFADSGLDLSKVGCFNVKGDGVIPEAVSFTGAVAKRDDEWFEWNGKEDPEFKMPVAPSAHNTPNTTLFHPTKKISALDHFRLFARKALDLPPENYESKAILKS